MRVLIVSPAFHPARAYGGPIESMYQLSMALAAEGVAVEVLTTDADGAATLDVPKSRTLETRHGVRTRYEPRLVRETVAPRLVAAIPRAVATVDVVHLNGVYNFPTFPTLVSTRAMQRPLVWTTRGALMSWGAARRARLKRAWNRASGLFLGEHVAFHATSPEEAQAITQAFPNACVRIVANGVNIPADVRWRPSSELRLCALGRLHPVKALDRLLDACALLPASLPWRLSLAGDGDAHRAELHARAQALGIAERVHFKGYVSDEEKPRFFSEQDVLVCPSHSENFGLVIAEAMAHGLPVIASRGTPWSRLEEARCGAWVHNDPTSLAHAIENAWGWPRREMGERGRDLVRRDFDWRARAREMIGVYEDLMQLRREGAINGAS